MTVLERLEAPRGELALRQAGDHVEIISNGTFLMDTRGGESERLLVRAAIEGRDAPARLLIGGLGVGFSLVEALRYPAVRQVTVVEVEPAIIGWHAGPLARYSGGALADPRVEVVCADLLAWLPAGTDRYDAICLDIDNGPHWTVTPANAALYGDAGLDTLAKRLTPDGTLAVWSAGAVPDFERRLRTRFATVRALPVEVPRGEPDVVYLASGLT